MSSISEVNGVFAQNAATLGDWRDRVQGGSLPLVRGHVLTDDDRLRGTLIKQLLCNLELPLDAVPPALAPALEAVAATAADGLVVVDHDRITVTELGRYFLRNLCLPFDAYLPTRTSDRVFSRTL
jgi:oxygen-independent coproporphyrinogen-3 oxidase